jgi:hypothetical protein
LFLLRCEAGKHTFDLFVPHLRSVSGHRRFSASGAPNAERAPTGRQ